MAFPVSYANQYDFDVFPRVVVAGRETEITIRPLGSRRAFQPGETYEMTIKAINQGSRQYFPDQSDYQTISLICLEDGSFRFSHVFKIEQEYLLDIPYVNHRGASMKERFRIYCVEEDLRGLYPFIGDLHIHTNCSDGTQNPEVVCANYRRHGYDFIAVTDHRRYYPSIDAMNFYKDVPTELTIVPGEEVHMPKAFGRNVDPHIVNFGGEYSVNALVERDDADNDRLDVKSRSLFGKCPDIMNQQEYEETIEKAIDGMDIPENVDRVTAAGIKYVCDEIRRANGLAISAHPTWISDVFHVPDCFQDWLVENRIFDAFEVLGGENYFEQNGLQTVRYYEDKARGFRYPVVGSTDSHNSYPTNRNAYICSTIIFAKENERVQLIDAVKNFRSVAVDTISAEFRLVGEMRLVKYGCFLLKNYFPQHDELCMEEGRLMKQYAVGTEEEKEEARRVLSVLNGRVEKLRKKYFAF